MTVTRLITSTISRFQSGNVHITCRSAYYYFMNVYHVKKYFVSIYLIATFMIFSYTNKLISWVIVYLQVWCTNRLWNLFSIIFPNKNSIITLFVFFSVLFIIINKTLSVILNQGHCFRYFFRYAKFQAGYMIHNKYIFLLPLSLSIPLGTHTVCNTQCINILNIWTIHYLLT